LRFDIASPASRSLLSLLLALFACTLGIGIIVPILPLYAETLGASGIWIGLVFSGYAIAQIPLLPAVGLLSDRTGRKACIVAGLLLYALVSLGLAVAESPEILTLVRCGQGAAAAMIIPIAQAYVGEIAPKQSEGTYMGLFSFVLFAGFGMGPLLGGILLDLYGVGTPIYFLSGLNFLAFLTAGLFLPSLPAKGAAARESGRVPLAILRNRVIRALLVFRVSAAVGRGGIIAFLPIFAHHSMQLSSSQIGVVISSNILLSSLLMMPFGILADRVNRNALVLIGGFLLVGLVVFLPFLETFTHLLLISLAYGALGAMVLPAASAIIVEEGKAYGMGTAMGFFTMAMSFGIAIGPPATGWVLDELGLPPAFFFLGAVGLFGVAFFALSGRPPRDRGGAGSD
jgi:MFS family permease